MGHDRCDQMIAILRQAMAVQQEEMRDLRRRLNAAIDQILVLAKRPEATSLAVDTGGEATELEETRSSAEIEADEIAKEEALIDQVHRQAEAELQRYAGDRGIPVDALRDV